jgi:N-acetylglucosamine kinase-like BadF-type ATPase
MDYILGVDGGNTKTIAVVAALDGTILGAGRSGCGDIYGYDTSEPAIEQIALAVDSALEQAGQTRESLAAACFSLAGADWREDYDFLHETLSSRGYGRTIRIYNDALGALRAGSLDGTGVVIACGTGVAIAARNAAGDFWHASFWVESLCGRELGNQALRALLRAELGITPPTALTAPILGFFDQSSVENLLRRFYLRPLHPPDTKELSQLAPIVLREAEAGDPVAIQIVIHQGERLAEYALAAARQVGIESTPFTLILNGGIFRHRGNVLVDAILNRVRQNAPDVAVVRSAYEPVIGALLLAFETAGISVTPALIERLDRTLPHDSLFAT